MKNFIELQIIHISKKCEEINDQSKKSFIDQKIKVLISKYFGQEYATCHYFIRNIKNNLKTV